MYIYFSNSIGKMRIAPKELFDTFTNIGGKYEYIHLNVCMKLNACIYMNININICIYINIDMFPVYMYMYIKYMYKYT
jgi:hypothetical protein